MSAKLLISTSIAALSLVSTGFAADLRRAPAPIPTASAVNYWSGLYLGLHAGVGGGTTDYPIAADLDGVTVSGAGHIDGSGWLYGAQAGYNWVLPNRIVLGLEADISGTDMSNELKLNANADFDINGTAGSGSANAHIGTKVDYLGTVRARVGYIVTDPWLVYISGGWAYASTKSSVSAGVSGEIGGTPGEASFSASKSNFLNGWALGIGTEYAITPNFSFRAEYLHVDMQSKTVIDYTDDGVSASLKIDPTYDLVRAGFNYRFGDFAPPTALQPAAYAAPVAYNWSGLHVGINGGYGAARTDYPIAVLYDDGDDDYADIGGKAKMRGGGALAGAQIGYDYAWNRVLVGLEADIAWSNIEGNVGLDGSAYSGGTYVGSANAEAGTKLDYLGTVRARLGYVVTDPWLVYATGGWAYGRVASSASINVDTLFNADVSKTSTMSGWAAGIGSEFAVAPNFTVKAEYLHVDLGSDTLWSGSDTDWDASLKIKPTFDIFRVGANYKFGG